MPLGPKTKAFFEKLTEESKNTPTKLMVEMPIDEFRKQAIQDFADLATEFPPGVFPADFESCTLCLDDGHKVAMHLYVPPGVDANQPAPTIVYFYGGGFCLNLCKFQQSSCAILAKNTNCKVIMIEHPLAPEYQVEEIFNICFAAVVQLFQQSDHYHIGKNNFIMAGCSSGATIAAWITNKSLQDERIEISQQVLITPLVDVSLEIHNNNKYVEFQRQDIMLTNEAMTFFSKVLMTNSDTHPKSPEISPYYQELSSSLPATLIIVGECDGLRGDGASYAEVLKQAGCEVTLTTLAGQTHNFLSCRKVLDDPPDPAVVAAKYITEHLNNDQ